MVSVIHKFKSGLRVDDKAIFIYPLICFDPDFDLAIDLEFDLAVDLDFDLAVDLQAASGTSPR